MHYSMRTMSTVVDEHRAPIIWTMIEKIQFVGIRERSVQKAPNIGVLKLLKQFFLNMGWSFTCLFSQERHGSKVEGFHMDHATFKIPKGFIKHLHLADQFPAHLRQLIRI